MAFDADGAIQAAHIDFVSDCGAYPTPWPVGPAAAVGMLFPGPVPRAARRLRDQDRSTRTRSGRTAYRGPWQFEIAGPRGAARHRGAPDGHRPGRAAPPQPAAPRRAAVREPQRHDLRQHLAARDVRAGAGDARLRRVPRRAGRRRARPAATSASGVSNYVEPSTPGLRLLRHRGGDDPHRAVGHGQRVHRRRLDREQHRDHGRAAHRRRARRRTSTTSTRSRATPRSPASAPARPAAGAGR